MSKITELEKNNAIIANVLPQPDNFKKERKYWGDQSGYKRDGKSYLRIAKMIEHFIATGERKQIGDIN